MNTSTTSKPSNSSADEVAHTGLGQDLAVFYRAQPERRRLLRMLVLAGVAPASLLACMGRPGDPPPMGQKNQFPDAVAGSCTVIPSETEGPFPGDGTNGANALTIAGMVRRDIRSTITNTGVTGTVAAGVPLTISLQLKKGDQNCASLVGYVVYVWHCDRDGNYSMYSRSVKDENYLRGVLVADADGKVSFSTIFPGCYDGRYPHVHFEVFPSLDKAVSGRNMVKTSQLTFTESVFSAVYASSGYASSAKNLADTSLAKDMVFSDGVNLQIAATTGSVPAGYVATLQVVV